MVDTLRLATDLEQAGMTAEQARATSAALARAVEETIVTRSEFAAGMSRIESGMQLMRSDLDGQMRQMQAELEAQMRQVRADLEVQIRELRNDLEGQIRELRTDLEGQIRELRNDLEGQIRELRTDLEGQIQALRTDMERFKSDLTIRIVAIVGLAVAILKIPF